MSGGRKYPSLDDVFEGDVLVTIYLRDGTQDAQIATLAQRSERL